MVSLLAAAWVLTPLALGADANPPLVPPLSLAQATPIEAAPPATEAPSPVTRGQVETEEKVEEKTIPISLAVSYYLLSDYVFRGINFSEYAGEGREKPNHQLTTSVTWDTGDFGRIGFDTFFEWYAAQKKLNPYGGQNLQEVDYVIRWSYLVEPIATDATVGFTFYTFPNLAKLLRTDRSHGNNNNDRTQEWWFKLAHNDAWMFKWLFPENEDGVLNPTMLFVQDVGIAAGRTWMEFGISHTFEVVENLTITPGYLVAVDGGVLRKYLSRPHADTFRLAYDQLSLNTTYDLTGLLHLPKWAGTLSVSGLLYFNNALGNAEDDGTINDEFYGGMSVNWGWGG
jgi:hypothetical protein